VGCDEPHLRGKWVVSHEGKGLDWVMEVHVGGGRKKDAEYNVRRYACLGIPEYFIFDRARVQLLGYRLPRGAREYVPMKPRKGRYVSRCLGLELGLVDGRLRFYDGTKLLLTSEEILARLEQRVQRGPQRLDEIIRRRLEAERRVAELQAELARLKRTRS
jgi:hypothetical protein